jgi:Family of unknown function (DUF6445)
MAIMSDRGGGHFRRFLLVRDDFYPDPEAVRRIAQSMTYREDDEITGYMTDQVYQPPGTRRRLERILGIAITRWDEDPDEGNGMFYGGFSGGSHKEVPGVHYDEPEDDITIVVYLTPGLPPECGTSLWQHKATGIASAPRRADARRLKTSLTKLRARLERDSTRRDRWTELDRAGYRYNRLVAYASGMFHSASRHYGANLRSGRLYQAFRVGVDWSTCRIYS